MTVDFFNNNNINHQKYNNSFFSGPLFIIGMPRSGTKLLRSLLNNHPLIEISGVETNFLPLWYSEWNRYGDLSDIKIFKFFFNCIQKYSYFFYMKEENKLISYHSWYNLCESFSLQHVYEALIRHDTNTPISSNKIWGDKSPNYIHHLSLLNKLFPEARFIHIIRDVRDYCISINKAWGKNMFRAAQRWRIAVKKVKYESKQFGDRFYEIKYEELISETNMVLKGVCNFLNIGYIDAMSSITKPIENLGDATNLRIIKKDNKNKYKIYLNPKRISTIESLTADALLLYGYDVKYTDEIKEHSRLTMFLFKLADAFNLFNFYYKEKGILKTLRWNCNIFKIHSKKYTSVLFRKRLVKKSKSCL